MRRSDNQVDAIVIGSGPNGLAAAVEVARTGRNVVVFEAKESVGGGARTAESTLPGFRHDVCSTVFPFAAASRFFLSTPLERFGLRWIESPSPLAHPLDDGAAVLERSIAHTAERLGQDRRAYRSLFEPLARDWPLLEELVMSPPRVPRHPVAQLRFARRAVRSATALADRDFRGSEAKALFAGIAAHGMLPLDRALTAGVGLTLQTLAHAVGWPIPRGGAQAISDALAAYLRSLGGRIVTGVRIDSLEGLPPASAVFCDLSPAPLLRIAGDAFPPSYRRSLESYRYGAAAFKMDWALSEPIPWRTAECAQSATVHLGGDFSEIADAEALVGAKKIPDRPFVILSQPTLFDRTRAPAGKHVAWAYCHVPNGSSANMADRIERQVERFAPGFRDCILARRATSPAEIAAYNPNFAGGDIGSGAVDWKQFFLRPNRRLYTTPARGVYICSAATPPGVGVHGMCGFWAARRALRRELK